VVEKCLSNELSSKNWPKSWSFWQSKPTENIDLKRQTRIAVSKTREFNKKKYYTIFIMFVLLTSNQEDAAMQISESYVCSYLFILSNVNQSIW
jgi:hypothetical protein